MKNGLLIESFGDIWFMLSVLYDPRRQGSGSLSLHEGTIAFCRYAQLNDDVAMAR
jgi:hypothetical protein